MSGLEGHSNKQVTWICVCCRDKEFYLYCYRDSVSLPTYALYLGRECISAYLPVRLLMVCRFL